MQAAMLSASAAGIAACVRVGAFDTAGKIAGALPPQYRAYVAGEWQSVLQFPTE